MRSALILLFIAATSALSAQDRAQQEFYSNGRLKSTHYTMGAKEWFIAYHENGRVKEMGGYFAGKPDGEWKQFDDRGQMLTQANFLEGRREGTWLFSGSNGNTLGRLQFKNGSLLRGEQFDPSGALVAQREYR